MNAFFNILQSVTNITVQRYPSDIFVESETRDILNYNLLQNNIVILINCIYYKRKQTNTFISAKFSSLNSILENTFIKKELKEDIFNTFSKSQKCYNSFSKLVNIYRTKKNPYIVKTDLLMNSLDPKNKNTFILIENKSNYLFSINELITIIENAIGNSPDFFSEPLYPLNPYNNQPLTLSTLYNIYFQMRCNGRVLPMLFHCFFLENFDKDKFGEQYEMLIRETAIRKYVFNSPTVTLYPNIIRMLNNNIYTRKFIIHNEFPKELLVNIFRPFLFCHYMVNYYIRGTTKLFNYKHLLKHKLKYFYEFNKSFGRKTVKLTKINNKIINYETDFNTDHISFYKIPDSSVNGNTTVSLAVNNFNYIFDSGSSDDEQDYNNDDY